MEEDGQYDMAIRETASLVTLLQNVCPGNESTAIL